MVWLNKVERSTYSPCFLYSFLRSFSVFLSLINLSVRTFFAIWFINTVSKFSVFLTTSQNLTLKLSYIFSYPNGILSLSPKISHFLKMSSFFYNFLFIFFILIMPSFLSLLPDIFPYFTDLSSTTFYSAILSKIPLSHLCFASFSSLFSVA